MDESWGGGGGIDKKRLSIAGRAASEKRKADARTGHGWRCARSHVAQGQPPVNMERANGEMMRFAVFDVVCDQKLPRRPHNQFRYRKRA